MTENLFISIIEILIIACLINYILSFFWNTRSMDLIVGLLFFIGLFLLSSWLPFHVLHKIMLEIIQVAVIGIIVIFQPELRMALSKFSIKGKKFKDVSQFDRYLDALSTSIYRLSEKRIGAIIVLENADRLDEYADKAVKIDADFSGELVESIFLTSTPLHDGAVIIRDLKLLAASVILPLADHSPDLDTSMGTRHRAALGITQLSDAIAIVISEETGKVSLAREGFITQGIKSDRFKGIMKSIYASDLEKSRKYSSKRMFKWKRSK